MEWVFIILAIGIASASIVIARNARAHARLALRESKKAIAAKEEAENALISIIDDEGNVRERPALPGLKLSIDFSAPPTTTPCGRLCRHAFFIRKSSNPSSPGYCHCGANLGLACGVSRLKFLDIETNNCVMFERNKYI